MEEVKKHLNNWIKILIIIGVFIVLIILGARYQSDRQIFITCSGFEQPAIWATNDGFEVSLHYSIQGAPRPELDKTIQIFWNDGSSTNQSIGLGSSMSGIVRHKYVSLGNKKIEVFFGASGLKNECGLDVNILLENN